MTIKAVFFDIDGTLLTDNRTVLSSTILAINQLKQAGYVVGIATGRGPKFSLPYMAALNLDVAICYNGQYILSREGVISAQALPVEDLKLLIDYASKKRRDLSFGTATDVVGSRLLHIGIGRLAYMLAKRLPNFMAHFLMTGFNQVYRRLRPRSRASMLAKLNEPIYQVIMLASKRETDNLSTHFPNLKFTRSSPFAADIINQGMSKLCGIARVGEAYNFDLPQVMAFGDSENDLEMLAGVGYGVAMGNANRQVKQIADYVTQSNNHSGIAQALRHYQLIEGEV